MTNVTAERAPQKPPGWCSGMPWNPGRQTARFRFWTRTATLSSSSSRRTGAEMSRVTFPVESAEYRRARNTLLAKEIALREHIEAVAAQDPALPRSDEVREDVFERIGRRRHVRGGGR